MSRSALCDRARALVSAEDGNLVIGGGKASFAALHFTAEGTSIKLVNEGFTGEADGVLIGPGAWREFVEAVSELELTRRGCAELRSYENDFTLRILAHDRAGHIGLEGRLMHPKGDTEVRVSFDLDPTKLPQIAKRLAELTWRGPSWLPN